MKTLKHALDAIRHTGVKPDTMYMTKKQLDTLTALIAGFNTHEEYLADLAKKAKEAAVKTDLKDLLK